MRPLGTVAATAVLLAAAGTALSAQEVIVDIRVHGNTVSSEEEIVRAAGLTAGAPFSEAALESAAASLRGLRRFERVEIRKRFASIADPTRIVVVILVDEGPVRIVSDDGPGGAARAVRRRAANLMFMPVVGAEDGYGLTYGLRVSIREALGPSSLVSFPLTWGGDKRAAVEVRRDLPWRAAPRLAGGALVQRRTHPFVRDDLDRTRAWARADWQLARPLRVGTSFAWQHLSLGGDRLDVRSAGADVVLDTRLDPLVPRNAVFARASIERVGLAGRSPTLTSLDVRGYIGLIGQSVAVVRALREHASAPLPRPLQPMLGGDGSLRGFRTGTAIGDTLLAGSAEIRVPLTSPLAAGRAGVRAFADVGTVYSHGGRLRDQRMETGVGGGVWMGAAVFHSTLDVARGLGSGTRVHVAAGFEF